MSTTHSTARPVPADARHSVLNTVGMAVAATFLLVGVLGFIPGITTHMGDIEFAGHDSHTELLGIFHVSVLHNLVHLLFGAVGLALSRTAAGAKWFLIGGGLLYAVVAVYGFAIEKTSDANFLPMNTADDWLHTVLAVGMIALGAGLGSKVDDHRTTGARV
jgi:hypothetical protein